MNCSKLEIACLVFNFLLLVLMCYMVVNHSIAWVGLVLFEKNVEYYSTKKDDNGGD